MTTNNHNIILKECALHEPCSYIEGNTQSIHYKVIQECTKDQCEALILRGWRRFGSMYFRPICQECRKCESLKIDVERYTFSKSERRILRKNSHLNTFIRQPTLTREHLDLFDHYHRYKHITRSWDAPKSDPKNYYSSFVQGHGDFGFEVLYFEEEKLIAVDLIDILEEGISALYCYYDPEYNHLSLGRYTLLQQIEFAKRLGLKWIYLGYYVEGCQSLAYKSTYSPSLELIGRPEEDEIPIWRELPENRFI
ncbi:MAG: arginyltransferase [Sulfuricurvum sp. PD_MW2]|uniref:arginyltransferase n=1 Tax=Sulfuricurvum sp. PD_MW2 TaxID=2027917 RepID=UPI000C062DDA|nr:arginyltransferase [Sulfuricurvum sp. PD_MW2]PHM18231.1 MAG: arginyltransferase [Sulfuricurvum sp. PD_MW2]